MAKKILVADDDLSLVELIKTALEIQGFEVITAFNGTDALAKGIREKPDLILLDILLPGVDGITLLRELRAEGLKCEVIILTASPILHVQEGVRLGIYAYLNKALSTPKEIVALIKEATKRKDAAK